MFKKKTIRDINLAGKVVLLRADYNVPIKYTDDGEAIIMNDFRIRESLPTIDYLLANGVKKIIIISHLGRPKAVDSAADVNELEKLNNGMRKNSLRPVFYRLRELLADRYEQDFHDFINEFPMNFHSAPIFSHTRYSVPIAEANDDYKIEMLENLRFSSGEKKNSDNLAKSLAQITGADIFIQDGFGVVHRTDASTSAITTKLPSVAGLLLEKEVSTISQAFSEPKSPFVAVLGGAKIGDKLPLIDKFIQKADKILITGAMANTFFSYKKMNIGKSKIELGENDIIDEIYEKSRRKVGVENLDDFIILPTDFATTNNFVPDSDRTEKMAADILDDDIILDLGENSIREIEKTISEAKTVVWNGTVGYAEYINFAVGSERTAKAMAALTENNGTTIIGGGDTSAMVLSWQKTADFPNEFSLISTGGGAALELMSGTNLPGVEALEDE